MHGEEHRGDVGADDRFKCGERGPADRRVAGNAGIGKDNVELAELFNRLLDCLFGRRDIGRVGHDRQRIRPQLFRSRLERRLISPGNRHPRALGHEQPCCRKPDAAVAACNQCRLVCQSHGSLRWLHY